MIEMYKDTLKLIRNNANLTQQDMSNIIQISKSQYNNYETEYSIIPIKHLNTLCNYFHLSLDYIFNFTKVKNYENIQEEINKIKSGQRLRELRKCYHLNQTELATFLNTSFSNISAYERGINIINTSFLYTICKKYNISADYLLGKIDHPKYLK